MKAIVKALKSTIGKKLVMAVTGLLLFGFLVTHVAGNLLLFVGEEAFNDYAHMLESNPLLPLAEVGLLALFGVHIACAISLTLQNKKARPTPYEEKQWAGARSLGSSTMIISGMLVTLFLVVHLYDFRISKYWVLDDLKVAAASTDTGAEGSQPALVAESSPPAVVSEADGAEKSDIYGLVQHRFAHPLSVLLYLVCLAGLGLHLSHGVQSVVRTLGFGHPKYIPLVQKASMGLTALVVVLFALMPLWFFLVKGA